MSDKQKQKWLDEYHKRDKEKIRENKRKYFSIKENRERKREIDKKYQKKKRAESKESILEYTRKHREKYPEKHQAVKKVFNAVKKGILKRSNCENCGSSINIQGHHEDYSKPLEFIWLCPPCHNMTHRKLEN